jgi:F-type H+-transporting ATPase subunit b
MASLLPLALAEGGLTDINLGLTIWTVVLFLIFATVMKKLAWGPLLAAIEEREKSVRDSLEGASRARDESAALLEQHKTLMRDAGREREEIIKRALAESETLKADLAAKARTESEQMVQRAREQIEREKNQAIQELRGQVADLAMTAASKIVTSSLTPEAQKKLVDEFITSIPRVES